MLLLKKTQFALQVLILLILCIVEASKLDKLPLSKAGRDKLKSVWAEGLSSSDEIEEHTGFNVGSIAEQIERNLGIGFSNSPSVTPTLTPTPCPTPSSSSSPSASPTPTTSPTPSATPTPSKEPSRTPSKSPSPTPFRNRKESPSPSPSSTSETVTVSTDIFEVPTDGTEVENEMDLNEISDLDNSLELAEVGEKVTINDFSIDGDLEDVPITGRQLFSETVLNRTAIRQTLRTTNFYLNINGQVIRMRIKVKCKGSLQPIEDPISIEEKLVKLKSGGTGLKAVYRLTGPSGNRCKVIFSFKITRRKKLKPATSTSFIVLPTISPMPQFISASPSVSSSTEISYTPEPSSYSSQAPNSSPSYSTSATPSVSASISTSFGIPFPSMSSSVSASASYSISPTPESTSMLASISSSASPAISNSISSTPSASVSTTVTASLSSSASAGISITISPTPSASASVAASILSSVSATISSSISFTPSASESTSMTASPSSSISAAISRSISPTPSASTSLSASGSPSLSASASITPVPSRAVFNWQESSDAIWAMGCNFIGNSLERVLVQGYQCSGACGGKSGCTHFAWTQLDGGSCYLKGPGTPSLSDAVANTSPGAVCGILRWFFTPSPRPSLAASISSSPSAAIRSQSASASPSLSASTSMTPVPSRVVFNWQESSDAIWAMGCDFIGNHIERVLVQGYQCSGECGEKSGCTHFVWTELDGGSCYLKGPATRSAYEAIANASPGSVCGILKWAIPPSPTDPAGRASDNWALVLEDNFDTFNDAVWSYETVDALGGWGNHEIQIYTTNNAFILDGILNVQLRKEVDGSWTSSRLRTKDKFEFTFGRVDTRLRMERHNGVWPAVWALSDKCTWPLCGEIDLFEMQTAWNYIPSSLHMQSNHAGNAISFRNIDTNTAEWRIYSMEWTPSYIAFFHDHREIGRYNKPLDATQVNWPFTSDNPFFLIINNAMYPQLWGSPPDNDLTQHTLFVDYIKVWAYPGTQ